MNSVDTFELVLLSETLQQCKFSPTGVRTRTTAYLDLSAYAGNLRQSPSPVFLPIRMIFESYRL
jgi:hypothetical protein